MKMRRSSIAVAGYGAVKKKIEVSLHPLPREEVVYTRCLRKRAHVFQHINHDNT
jgi:hypothetical protein